MRTKSPALRNDRHRAPTGLVRRLRGAAFLRLLAVAALLPATGNASMLAIVGGTVADLDGGAPIVGAVIVVAVDRISAIGAGASVDVPEGADVMTPLQALRTVTIEPARMLGAADGLGSLAAGKYADIVAVAGDPSSGIRALREIVLVVKDGKVYRNRLP